MSSNFHIVMNTGICVLVYAVLHGIAQIPVGKAQNLAQNELKFSYSDEEQQRYLCVYVCRLHGIAQIPVGEAQNLAQNELKFSYSDEHRYLCVDVCCFAWNSSNSSGESSKSSSK